MFQKPSYDPGPETYCVSFIWGDQSIAWNTKKVEQPKSWGALWNPKYKGRIAMFGSGTSAIPVTAMYLGQDPNNITDLEAVKAKLLELRPNLLKFWKGGAELTQLLATEEVWMADFWRGRVNKLKEEGHPIEYTQPKEGSFAWIDCIVIPPRTPRTAGRPKPSLISRSAARSWATLSPKGSTTLPSSSARSN